MDPLEHEIEQVIRWIKFEFRDDVFEVDACQRVTSTKVDDVLFQVWDVRSGKYGWWVITPQIELYYQHEEPSADNALTYHVGSFFRMREHSRAWFADDVAAELELSPRRLEQAVEEYMKAEEAESYQAVGMRCREVLITLVRDLRKALPEPASPPQGSNVVEWTGAMAEILATGRQRAYLKASAKYTWDLANALTHQAGAVDADAELVLSATQHAVDVFGVALVRHQRGPRKQCPRCESFLVTQDGGVARMEPNYVSWSENVCRACQNRWSLEYSEQAPKGEVGWVSSDFRPANGAHPRDVDGSRVAAPRRLGEPPEPSAEDVDDL